jgi:hypothetical protein
MFQRIGHFAWNGIRGFKASSADFLCLGNDNMLIGTSCKVEDKGNGNTLLTKYWFKSEIKRIKTDYTFRRRGLTPSDPMLLIS